jgi:hypothetical protein
MSPEVLIYIQNLKLYFEKHPDASKYFTPDGNDNPFFDYVSEIAQKNFDKYNEAQLTLEQFEEARIKTTKGIKEMFISLGDVGFVSSN